MGTLGSQSPEGGGLGCCVAVLNRHISSILKEFLSMVFFMVFPARGKAKTSDTMSGMSNHSWYFRAAAGMYRPETTFVEI